MGPKLLLGHIPPTLYPPPSNNKDAPRFAGGIWWAGGLLAPVPVPVGVLVWRLRVLNAFLGDPGSIRPEILRALGEANLNGAGGFFDVGGAFHARIVTHRPLGCKGVGGNLFDLFAGGLVPVY